MTTTPTLRPLHTYSVVARDPETGELGVAVQSHWFSVGSLVSWAEPGVGAVATQSFVEPAYGPQGLALMAAGTPAPRALESLLEEDEANAVRQVAMVDSHGRAAAHTGERCIPSAGHHVAEGFSVQANMMRNDRVVPAMAEAFESASGHPLAERLLETLRAAERAGGDVRGRQSAALVVVTGTRSDHPWRERPIELRVEDHPDPVEELARLLDLHRAYSRMNDGDAALQRGEMDRALAEYAAASRAVPDSIEIAFWNAVTLATNGRLDQARPIFADVFARDPSWRELLTRLPGVGLVEAALVEEISGPA